MIYFRGANGAIKMKSMNVKNLDPPPLTVLLWKTEDKYPKVGVEITTLTMKDERVKEMFLEIQKMFHI